VPWGELSTRQLLRQFRTPAASDDEPIARALAGATGIADPLKALQLVVEQSLRPFPSHFWTIVRRIDFEGATAEAVAAEIDCSVRSVYRYRAAAVKAIRREIELVGGTASPSASADDCAQGSLLARGRYLRSRRTPASLIAAQHCFEQALGDFPSSAHAYAGLAEVHLLAAEMLLRDPAAALRSSAKAVETGLRVDPSLADLYALESRLLMLARRAGRASASVERALAMPGRTARTSACAAWIAMLDNDLSAAAFHAQRALESGDDALAAQTMLGIVLCRQGDAHAGVAQLESVLDLEPGFSYGRCELARALIGRRRYDDAHHHLAILLAQEPRRSYAAMMSVVCARRGDSRRAAEYLDEPGGTADLCGHGGHYLRAYAHLALKQKTQALTELQKAVDAREPWTAWMHLDEVLADLSGRTMRAAVSQTRHRGRAESASCEHLRAEECLKPSFMI
jgi:tetratricopeptide (TPR) repeat protein